MQGLFACCCGAWRLVDDDGDGVEKRCALLCSSDCSLQEVAKGGNTVRRVFVVLLRAQRLGKGKERKRKGRERGKQGKHKENERKMS